MTSPLPGSSVHSRASHEPRRLQHDRVTALHVLLGLVCEGEGIGAKVIEQLGAALDDVRADARRQV